MAKNWISLPRVEGTASRQAHVNLPPGTYEREMGKEGFFGPATHMYHRHPPTGWVECEGRLQPAAFDTVKLKGGESGPWAADLLLHNASVQFRLWRQPKAMDHLVRNADGDELIFIHAGAGDLFCDRVGPYEEMLPVYGMDARAIAAAAHRALSLAERRAARRRRSPAA